MCENTPSEARNEDGEMLLVLGEDGQLRKYVPGPELTFMMPEEELIEFLVILARNEETKPFMEENKVAFDNVSEDFFERLNEKMEESK